MANMDALLRIRADVQGANGIVALGRSLQGVEQAATTTSVAMRGLQSAVGGLVGLVGGVTIITKIFGDTATLQTQTRSLEVLLGSASKAGQIIKELQAYGSVTPFESTELIETAKRLGAFGVVGQRVVEVTKRLGDIAGATGANLGELATAYGQVVSKGRLQTEELLQFQERGVGIQAELQKMYGLSGQELQKALSAGRVSSEAFEQAIIRLTEKGGKYANGAVAQSDTLTGRLSTLKDTVTTLSQTIGAKLEPAMNRVLLIATAAVDKFNRAMGMGRAADLQGIAADGFSNLGQGRSVAEKRAAFQAAERLANAATPQKSAAGIDQNIGALQQAVSLLRRITSEGLDERQINLLQDFGARLTDRIAKEKQLLEGLKKEDKPLKVPPLLPDKADKADKADKPKGAEINARALLATIRFAEGTLGPSGYGTHFGGSYTPPGGAHPNRVIRAGGYASAAYGAYQFMPDTWRGTGGGSMAPARQDAAALRLIRNRGVDPGQSLTRETIDKLAPEWASFPTLKTGTSYYGQGGKSFSQLQAFYRQQVAKGGGDVGSFDLAAGKEQARADEKAKQEKEQAAKQLTAAVDFLRTKEAALAIAKATDPLERLSLEYSQERSKLAQEYADKIDNAKSAEEKGITQQAKSVDLKLAEIGYQNNLTAAISEQLELERERAALLADSMARMEEMSTRSSIGTGAQQGIQAYVDSVGNLRDAVGQLTTNAIGGLEESLTSLATTGAGNFKAFAASVLKDATRMIIRQLVLKSIMQIIGGIGGGTAQSFEMPGSAFIPSGGYSFAPSALGNVFAANGIQPFAQGGIVSRPTLFPFAKGIGLMGEAGPEAIMPLRRGADGKLGVAGGGGGGTTNIAINVDASGTKAEGDTGNAGALARDLAAVVDERLIHHRRPGGLLAR